MKNIRTLTGLRGVAALFVFISHCATESILPDVFGGGFGKIGVMIFFVLSGFLMAYLYINEETDKRNILKYSFARIGRVFPLYYFVLGCSICISLFVTEDSFFPYAFFDVESAIRALFLIDAKHVFWTIPVEVQFYVIFVVFWVFYKKGFGVHFLFLFALMNLAILAIVFILFSKLPNVIFAYSFPFFSGVIFALFFDRIRDNAAIRRTMDRLGVLAFVLLFINLPELRLQYGLVISENFYVRVWGDPVTWCIVFAVFFGAALNSKSLSILNKTAFVYLGNISYGFYLIHYPILMLFVDKTAVNPFAKVILAFLVAVTLSHISLHYFEKPVGEKIRTLGVKLL